VLLVFSHRSFFFLNVLSQRCYHCCWLAWPWAAASLRAGIRVE